MGIGALNPNAARINPQIQANSQQNQAQQVLEEQLQHLFKTGFMGGKKKPLPKLPHAPVVPKQATAMRAVEAALPSLIKDVGKIKKKNTAEIQEDVEQLERAMDEVENTLDEILNMKDDGEGGGKGGKTLSKQGHLRLLFENVEEYYMDLLSQGASPANLALFATVFYERISKPTYNTNGKFTMVFFFKMAGTNAPSPFQGEIMFNYILDLTLGYPNSSNTDQLRPLKVMTDLLTNRPRGVPGFYAHLMNLDQAHWKTLCEIWAKMLPEFPFKIALPPIFGEEGCNALAQWCWDLILTKDEPTPDEVAHMEVFNKGFGKAFVNAVSIIRKQHGA